MPVVIATQIPSRGMLQQLVETYTPFLPATHAQEGCGFFTLHTSKPEPGAQPAATESRRRAMPALRRPTIEEAPW